MALGSIIANWNPVNTDPYGSYLDARDRREQREQRMETRQRERTDRSANEAWARALAADDLAAARDIAAKAGSPEAVQQVNDQVQRRVRQEAIRFNTELSDIARLPDGDAQRASRYAQLYQSTLQRASRWGLDRINPEAMAQFQQMYPAPGTESAAALAQAVQSSTQSVQSLIQQDMDADELWEAQHGQSGERRYAGVPGGILDTWQGTVAPNPYARSGSSSQSVDPNQRLAELGGSWDD